MTYLVLETLKLYPLDALGSTWGVPGVWGGHHCNGHVLLIQKIYDTSGFGDLEIVPPGHIGGYLGVSVGSLWSGVVTIVIALFC